MSPTADKIIEYLQTVETTYTDCRVCTQLELRSLVWFFTYGQNVFSESGRDWKGATFRQDETTCLMVVKSDLDGIRQVAYITDRTPTGCIVSFCKKWHGDRVEWFKDKYG